MDLPSSSRRRSSPSLPTVGFCQNLQAFSRVGRRLSALSTDLAPGFLPLFSQLVPDSLARRCCGREVHEDLLWGQRQSVSWE